MLHMLLSCIVVILNLIADSFHERVMVMVAHTVEERQIVVLHHDISHTSDHRIEHIERVECDITQCDSIDSRIIAGTHCPLDIRDGLPEES